MAVLEVRTQKLLKMNDVYDLCLASKEKYNRRYGSGTQDAYPAADSELLVDLKLDWKTMTVPTETARHMITS